MLTKQQLHSWIAQLKSDMNSYVNSDRNIVSADKTDAKNAYASLLDDLKSECDSYFSSMSSAPLTDAIIGILSYLSFFTIEDAEEIANMNNYFSCNSIFNEDLLSINSKEAFYDNGAVRQQEMIKLNNFISRVSGGASSDKSRLESAIGTMRSKVMANSFIMIFEVDKEKKPVISIDIPEIARAIYNTFKVYDIIKAFDIDIYIPSYIQEEHS